MSSDSISPAGLSLPLAARSAVTSSSASPEALARSLDGANAKQVAAKFEALFASLLVKEMRKALPEGFFGTGADGDIYGGWFDEHLGAAIAKDGGLHLEALVERGIRDRATPATDAPATPAIDGRAKEVAP